MRNELLVFRRLTDDPQGVLATIQVIQFLGFGNAFVVTHGGALTCELANQTARLSGPSVTLRTANSQAFLDGREDIVSQPSEPVEIKRHHYRTFCGPEGSWIAVDNHTSGSPQMLVLSSTGVSEPLACGDSTREIPVRLTFRQEKRRLTSSPLVEAGFSGQPSIRAKALSRAEICCGVRWAPPRRQKVEDQNSGKRILNHSAVDESFHHPSIRPKLRP